ncbi:MAG: F0F1 ATP synthase subunit gamma [Anaerolineaceae bacterium]|nr:F0F1 ATP synthase subunit gamma [Anaerolineaceae bacterium]
MAEDFERTQSRLNNISTVQPILGALRTISLGSWQSALKRQKSVDDFESHFQNILGLLLSQWSEHPQALARPAVDPNGVYQPSKKVMLIIGTERGLCGSFNQTLIRFAEERYHKLSAAGTDVSLWTLGSRAYRMLIRDDIEPIWAQSLSTTALPDYLLAYELTMQFLKKYESYELDGVEIVYNRYRGVGSYIPTAQSLIPPVVEYDPAKVSKTGETSLQELWPPPIIETRPMEIYIQVVEQLTTMSMYKCLLNSAASEHSARYQLMEEANQNSERMISDMTEVLQMYRRQKITQEMQELAVGAGLLS